ncbi:helix-turn-helix transcriptional regulator [Streptomyces sp. NPDC046316]|uniref:helix-turn-helix domain-containing protein n=1 Tax=Streptomyces sp. NPDC046316 TaxID=3154494 RepID=UPI0033F72582
MATVHEWTGLEALVLRKALRLSVRAFAEKLGVSVNTVSNWEKLLAKRRPKKTRRARPSWTQRSPRPTRRLTCVSRQSLSNSPRGVPPWQRPGVSSFPAREPGTTRPGPTTSNAQSWPTSAARSAGGGGGG